MRDTMVRRMFDAIAFSYDSQNSILSLGVDILWRKSLADMLEPDRGLVLDAATGTGEVALTVRRRRPGLTVVGLDFSPAMLAVVGTLLPVLLLYNAYQYRVFRGKVTPGGASDPS